MFFNAGYTNCAKVISVACLKIKILVDVCCIHTAGVVFPGLLLLLLLFYTGRAVGLGSVELEEKQKPGAAAGLPLYSYPLLRNEQLIRGDQRYH